MKKDKCARVLATLSKKTIEQKSVDSIFVSVKVSKKNVESGDFALFEKFFDFECIYKWFKKKTLIQS